MMKAIISLSSRLRRFPLLSPRYVLREGGHSLRCGAALARLPSPGRACFEFRDGSGARWKTDLKKCLQRLSNKRKQL